MVIDCVYNPLIDACGIRLLSVEPVPFLLFRIPSRKSYPSESGQRPSQ